MNEPASEIDTRVGSVLAGKYRLVRLLGSGGMGAVYEAHNEWTERRVAIKVLHGVMARDAEATARFMREARTATRVAHPNIVEVLDMGEDPADGSLYIVQEFLVGQDLRGLLNQRGSLPPREALEALMPVMAALVAAHRLGIVHRDIKPENIFLTKNSEGRRVPKLIDFGIAKIEGSESLGLTRTGAAMGTPYYMSPEQASGERDLDAQTDVWAIGVVLFEVLSGACPFEGENYNQLLARILTAPVPKLASVAPKVPAKLASAIDGALQRKRSQRYRSVALFLDAVIDAADFAGPEWQRSTRRWFDRQVGAFDDDGESETSVVVPDDLGEHRGRHRALTPTSGLEAGHESPDGSGALDVASRWDIQAPAPSSMDDDDGPPTNLLATPSKSSPSSPSSHAIAFAPAPAPTPDSSGARKSPLLVNALHGSTLVGMTPAHGSPALAVPSLVAPPASYAPVYAPPATSAPSPPPARAALVAGGAALLLFVGAAVTLVVLAPWRPAAPRVPVTTVLSATTGAPTAPVAPRARATYRVRVRLTPPNGTLELDGAPAPGNAIDLELPSDGRTHLVTGRAPERQTQSVSFRDAPPPEALVLQPAMIAIATATATAASALAPAIVRPTATPVAAVVRTAPPALSTTARTVAEDPSAAPRATARPPRPPVRVVRDYDED